MNLHLRLLAGLVAGLCIWGSACNGGEEESNRLATEPYDEGVTMDVRSLESIPSNIPIAGEIVGARSWADQAGQHLLVASLEGPVSDSLTPDFDEDMLAKLYVQQYRMSGDSIENTEWMWETGITQCPLDIWVNLDSVYITDVDNNGVRETAVVVSKACRSDVSPAQMQIVLHAQQGAYQLDGWRWHVDLGTLDTTYSLSLDSVGRDTQRIEQQTNLPGSWGRYRADTAFVNAPAAYQDYMRQLWRRHVREYGAGTLYEPEQ